MFVNDHIFNPFYLAFAEQLLGDCLLARGRFAQALDKQLLATSLFAQSVGPDHVYVANAQYSIGSAAHAAGHHQAALALFEIVDRWYLKNVNRHGNAAAQFSRARVLHDLGRAAEALEALDRIDRTVLANFVRTPGLDAWFSAERSRNLLALGRAAEAKPTLHKAVQELTALGMPKWEVAVYRKLL